MQSVLQKSGHAELAILALAVLLFAFLFFAGPAFAGADTTFNTALTKFTDFLEGSGGKIITVLSLAGGIVALASGRFSMGQIAIPVGVGVGAGTSGPPSGLALETRTGRTTWRAVSSHESLYGSRASR